MCTQDIPTIRSRCGHLNDSTLPEIRRCPAAVDHGSFCTEITPAYLDLLDDVPHVMIALPTVYGFSKTENGRMLLRYRGAPGVSGTHLVRLSLSSCSRLC